MKHQEMLAVMGGSGRTDETCIKILIDERSESRELNRRQ